MSRPSPYEIMFAPEVVGHLDAIERKCHGLIREKIDEMLTWTPEDKIRNRKPLDPPAQFGATWELRFGPDNRFRVFYETDPAERKVRILAVGVKVRNRLYIGGKEMTL